MTDLRELRPYLDVLADRLIDRVDGPSRAELRRHGRSRWPVAIAAVLVVGALIAAAVAIISTSSTDRSVRVPAQQPTGDLAPEETLFFGPMPYPVPAGSEFVFEEGTRGSLRSYVQRWPGTFGPNNVVRSGADRVLALGAESNGDSAADGPFATGLTLPLLVLDTRGTMITRYDDLFVTGQSVGLLGANASSALLQRIPATPPSTLDFANTRLVLFDLATGTERVIATTDAGEFGDLGEHVAITAGFTRGTGLGARPCWLTRVDLNGGQETFSPIRSCAGLEGVALSHDESHAAIVYSTPDDALGAIGQPLALRIAVVDLADGTVTLDRRLGVSSDSQGTRTCAPNCDAQLTYGLGALEWSRDSAIVRVGLIKYPDGAPVRSPDSIEIREIPVN